MVNSNSIAAFDQLLALLESQGHVFETYEELEAFVARSGDTLEDLETQIAAAQAA